MTHTLVIAELGSSWRFGYHHLGNAYKLIDAVKECGADVAKFQWTSNAGLMAMRRKLGADAIAMYDKYLMYPKYWLPSLKAHCDKVGIEFMCTVYLKEDIEVIAPLVKMSKISAFEAEWREFVSAHCRYEKPLIVSVNDGMKRLSFCQDINFLYCVSKYPTPIEELHLRRRKPFDGLSDHTTSTLTGALAVAAGASIVEVHCRLDDTPSDNPDYPHSRNPTDLKTYIDNIRIAERAL